MHGWHGGFAAGKEEKHRSEQLTHAKSIPAEKKLVFEQNNGKSSLLDESNIKEQ